MAGPLCNPAYLPDVPRSFYLRGMAFRRFNTLLDVAKQGYWVRIQCRCGHEIRTDPMKLLERLMRRGADTRLTHLPRVMKCGRCGGKNFEASHCEGPMITTVDTDRAA